MSTEIRKVVITSFGDVSNLQVVTASLPPPPEKHVQVRVIYSGFSGADINMRLGRYPLQKKAPLTPGYCLVGSVISIHDQSTSKFQPGDIVTCLTVYDAEAERVNLPEKYLIRVPSGLDLKQVTAFTLDWNTSYGLVYRAGKVSKGQRVFIHGMSGAVGYGIMALSLLCGAEVYGTASERNHAAIKELGAHPYVYTNKDWIAAQKNLGGADVVFDALGFESWDESWSILNEKGGHLIGYGGNLKTLQGDEDASVIGPTVKLLARGHVPFCSKKTTFFYISRDDKHFVPELIALFELLKEGKIEVPIKATYDLENIKDAHENWSKGSGMGSVIIKVSEEKV